MIGSRLLMGNYLCLMHLRNNSGKGSREDRITRQQNSRFKRFEVKMIALLIRFVQSLPSYWRLCLTFPTAVSIEC